MPKNVSIAEAKDSLPRLIHEAELGVDVLLTRRGRPVAVLVSVASYERLTGGTDFWDRLQAFRSSTDLTGFDVDDPFHDTRDRSSGGAAEW